MKRPFPRVLTLGLLALLIAGAGGCVYAQHEPGQGMQLGIAPPPTVVIDPEAVLPLAIGLGIIAGQIWGRGGGHCH